MLKMRSNLLSLFVCLFVYLFGMFNLAKAQKISVAPVAGFGLGKIVVEDDIVNWDCKYKLSFGGGIQTDYHFNDQFAISSGVLFVQKNGKLEYKNSSSNTDIENDLKLSLLEIPVLVKFNLPVQDIPIKSYIYGGSFLGIKLSAKYEETGTVLGANYSESGDIEDAESLDFGVILGAGIEYNKILFDVRYELGLRDIDKTSTSAKTRAFFFMIGYKFDFNL